MNQTLFEILLLVPTALCTGFLLFIAGVIQAVMNDVDEATFKRLLGVLVKHALRLPVSLPRVSRRSLNSKARMRLS